MKAKLQQQLQDIQSTRCVLCTCCVPQVFATGRVGNAAVHLHAQSKHSDGRKAVVLCTCRYSAIVRVHVALLS